MADLPGGSSAAFGRQSALLLVLLLESLARRDFFIISLKAF